MAAQVTIVFNSISGVVQGGGHIVEYAPFGEIDLNVQYNSQAGCGTPNSNLVSSDGAFHSNFSDSNVKV